MRLGLAIVSALPLFAQAPLTLSRAVELAVAQYPSIRIANEQTSVAAAQIGLARTAYLPRVDALGQVNAATHNNVFGTLLPQPLAVIPTLSGPVLRTNGIGPVWGTAVGVLASWEPFDLGQRKAAVASAMAGRDRIEAEGKVTRLQVATVAADAFLTLQAALELERAALAAVDRAKALDTIVAALVKSELRPGAEVSRTRAELAAARTQWIRAKQAIAVARAELAQMTGGEVASIAGDVLLTTPGALDSRSGDSAIDTHPILLAQKASIFESKTREEILNQSYKPKFTLEGAISARGTGIQPDGTKGNFVSGLGPNYQNWALGLNVTIPLMDLFQIRAKKDAEAHRNLAEQARYKLFAVELDAAKVKANANVDAAKEIAENIAIQVDAARTLEAQAKARYQAGLNNVTDLTDAERVLTQAEIDSALGRLNIWRAMLQLAAAGGDLAPFLKLAAPQ